jgi:hypothetical protein
MRRFFLISISLIAFFLFSTPIFAQNDKSINKKKYTINGYIKDQFSGETLIGATLSVKGNSKGVPSNSFGYYSITLNEGNYEITYSFIGYQSEKVIIQLNSDTSLNISLKPTTALSQEVVITASKKDNNVKSAQMGKTTLPIDQIKSVPAFLGEVDLLKVVQIIKSLF